MSFRDRLSPAFLAKYEFDVVLRFAAEAEAWTRRRESGASSLPVRRGRRRGEGW